MYKHLLSEIKRQGLRQPEIASALGISERSLRNKLSGATDFTVTEAQRFRDAYCEGMTIDYLFTRSA